MKNPYADHVEGLKWMHPKVKEFLLPLPLKEISVEPHHSRADSCMLLDPTAVLALMAHYGASLKHNVTSRACWLEQKGKFMPFVIGWAAKHRLLKDGCIVDTGGAYPVTGYAVSKHGMMLYSSMKRKKEEELSGSKKADEIRAKLPAPKIEKAEEKPPAPPKAPDPKLYVSHFVIGNKNATIIIHNDAALEKKMRKYIESFVKPSLRIEVPKEPVRKELLDTVPQRPGDRCFYCNKPQKSKPGRKAWRIACKTEPCAGKLRSDTPVYRELKKAGISHV